MLRYLSVRPELPEGCAVWPVQPRAPQDDVLSAKVCRAHGPEWSKQGHGGKPASTAWHVKGVDWPGSGRAPRVVPLAGTPLPAASTGPVELHIEECPYLDEEVLCSRPSRWRVAFRSGDPVAGNMPRAESG